MQINDISTDGYKHFFFRGYRVEAEGVSTGTNVQDMGVLAIKQRITTAGELFNDTDVLVTDMHYDPQADPPTTPIRIESDLAVSKPGLDVVVVSSIGVLPDFESLPPAPIPPPLPASVFGDIDINRIDGSSDQLEFVHYGLMPRESSLRVGLAGNPVALEDFNPANLPARPPHNGDILPAGYQDRFQNTAVQNNLPHLIAGDEVVWTQKDVNNNPVGPVLSTVIPDPATLTFLLDDKPVEPQPVVAQHIDTLIFDQSANEFLLTWRASFVWDAQLELAVLEVS